MKWIEDRHAALHEYWGDPRHDPSRARPDAPWPLRWFGEEGYDGIMLYVVHSEEDVERVRQLFPEAEVEAAFADGLPRSVDDSDE